MSTEYVLDIILIRDGDNLILRTKSEGLKIRMAFVDTNGAEGVGEGKITSIIQGQPTEAEVDSFLDMAKAQVEDFVPSGALDRERETFSSEERSVGTECVSKCNSLCSPYIQTKKIIILHS